MLDIHKKAQNFIYLHSCHISIFLKMCLPEEQSFVAMATVCDQLAANLLVDFPVVTVTANERITPDHKPHR